MIRDELKKIIAEQNLTQEEAAFKLGTTQSTLNLYLNGKRKISADFLEHFIEVFDLPEIKLTNETKTPGNRIEELRKKRNLTQENLADALGLSQAQVSRLESGQSDITLGQMYKIAEILGVKPYELLPAEWQPDQISPAEQEILNIIRKTKESDNETDSASATG